MGQDRSAGRGSGSSASQSGRAREATGVLAADLLVVQVEHKRELLGIGAEGVGAVLAGGTVGGDAHARDLAAHVVKQGLVVVLSHVAGDNAGQRVVHALADGLVGGRREIAGSAPVEQSGGRAGTGHSVGGLEAGRVDANRGGLGEAAGEVGVVGERGDHVVSANSDQAVVVLLFKVHVDNTAGPDVSHVGRVQGGGISKHTGLDDVAAVLGEEDRDGHVGKLGGSVGVTGGLKVDSGAAPFVHVDSVKVSGVGLAAAGKVVRKVTSGIGIVVSRVTNGDGSVLFGGHVSLCISNGGLDKGGSISVCVVVSNLITSKETQHVAVSLHDIDNGDISLIEVKSPAGRISNDGQAGLRHVGNDIDSVLGKQVHAVIVGLGGVDGVDSNDVCFQVEQVGEVSLAGCKVSQGVCEEGASGSVSEFLLVGDTLHEELGSVV